MSYYLVCLIFYLIGSFPTAYLLLKLKYKKNITEEGSGNVGAMNTLDVTDSKLDGIIVLVIDLLKGLLPVIWYLNYSDFDPELIIFPALLLLVGHNYSVWLKFKGGRGLSTAAGIMIAVNFTLTVIWLILYYIFYRFIKNVHISASIALILLPLSVIFLQPGILKFDNQAFDVLADQFRFLFSFTSAVCIVVLLRHISPILELINKRNIKIKK